MSLIRPCLISAIRLLSALTATPATALDFLHSQRSEAGRTCFTDHIHYGESGVHRSRRDAFHDAIRNWEEFTVMEYGDAWGRISLARSRVADCNARDRSGHPGWVCKVQARPCRQG